MAFARAADVALGQKLEQRESQGRWPQARDARGLLPNSWRADVGVREQNLRGMGQIGIVSKKAGEHSCGGGLGFRARAVRCRKAVVELSVRSN